MSTERIISVVPTGEYDRVTGHVRCLVTFDRLLSCLCRLERRVELQWVLS